MRVYRVVAALLFAAQAMPALAADRDPYSGAPLPPATREPASPITDHFYIRAAFYSPKYNTDFRVDPTNAPPGTTGTPVNAENDLGLPHRENRGVVDFMFRLRERNKVRVSYYETKRSGSQVQALGLRQEVTAATPFPALPLDLTWCLSRRWSATAQAAYLKVNSHNLSGWYLDTHADIQYRWANNFVVGAGYASIRTDLTHRNGSFPGVVNLSISGPQLFARFSF